MIPATVRPLPTPAPSPMRKPARVLSGRNCSCCCEAYVMASSCSADSDPLRRVPSSRPDWNELIYKLLRQTLLTLEPLLKYSTLNNLHKLSSSSRSSWIGYFYREVLKLHRGRRSYRAFSKLRLNTHLCFIMISPFSFRLKLVLVYLSSIAYDRAE